MSSDFRRGIIAGIVFSAILLWAVGNWGKLFAGDTWIVGSVASHHFDDSRPRDYEQRNWGLGVEHELLQDLDFVAGFYRNSIRRTSKYIGFAWSPLILARGELGEVKLGTAAIRIDGYGPKAMFAAFPVLGFEKRIGGAGIGINIPYAPKTKRNIAVAALQLKVLW